MTRKRIQKRKVLVAMNMAGMVSQRKLAGMFRYLEGASPWEIILLRLISEFTPECVSKVVSDGCDGAIISSPGPSEATEILARADMPVVMMEIHDRHLARRKKNTLTLNYSSDEIGKTAANLLVKSGNCRPFAFIHSAREMIWSVERHAAFRRHLRKFGLGCTDLHSPEGIQFLERPVGVLANHDDTGMKTIDFCLANGLKIPQDVQVVGIGNDTLICENCRPSLTSVQPDCEQEGFLAARELDRMMTSRRDVPAKSMSVGVKEVALRSSTTQKLTSGIFAQNVLAYARAHAFDGIGAEDIARRFNCSRRLLDMRFRRTMGKSLGKSMVDMRIAEAKRLLRTTDCTISEIADKCGYSSVAYLMTMFRREVGCTMADYRQSLIPPLPGCV